MAAYKGERRREAGNFLFSMKFSSNLDQQLWAFEDTDNRRLLPRAIIPPNAAGYGTPKAALRGKRGSDMQA